MTLPRIYHPAPAFSLPDLTGQMHHLSDYRGQVVILNFWSAECPWSERTDREFNALLPGWRTGDEQTSTPRVTLLPVASNQNESLDMLAAVANARGLSAVLHDANGQLASLYNAQTTPHLFVINPEGILQYQGAFDNVTFRQRNPSQHYLKDAIDALLRGDAPNPSETPAYGCAIVSFTE